MEARNRRNLYIVAIASALLATAVPASAQVTRELIFTEAVRIQASGIQGDYRFHGWEPEHLILQPLGGPTEGRYRVPLREIEEIRVQVADPQGRSTLGQVFTGGFVGGLVGAAIGAVVGDPIFGFWAVAVPGVAFGALVGAFAPPSTSWQPVTVPSVLELAPPR